MLIELADFETLVETATGDSARPVQVTVCVTLYNYAHYITEALDSLVAQDLPHFDLVLVEDCSTDHSLQVAQQWMRDQGDRFSTCRLLRHLRNSGLSAARNTAFANSRSEYVFVLDADNQLYPRCLRRCLETIERAGTAFAYPIIEVFGAEASLLGTELWDVDRLALGNYIDAMALIRRSAWEEAGGYSREMIWGWEDYDLWCKFAERGYRGVQVPEILARYRVHEASMIRTTTNLDCAAQVRMAIQGRHPWLTVGLDDQLWSTREGRSTGSG